MKLQIAFDTADLDKAVAVAHQIVNYCDIIEIGTMLIYKHGTEALITFKQTFPEKTILVDSKIVDRGAQSSVLFFEQDADWITVMAGTSKNVIHAACTKAHAAGKKVMLDLLDSNSPGQTALEAKSFGVNALLFHQPYDDEHSLLFLDNWAIIKGNSRVPIFVSAKITKDNIDKILEIKPDGIVIGKAITEAEDPQQEAQFFYNLCK